jgi:putative ABC transport system permease protein
MHCPVGRSVASALGIGENGSIVMSSGSRQSACGAIVLPATGGPEDNQIFFYLPDTQELLGQPHRISVIQMSVPGTAAQVEQFIAGIQPVLGDAESRPVRQFTEGEARLYGKISGILTATVAVVLVLTALCVMAAMTNVAMERKNDVGLMKAIGGSVRRVLRLFLAEAALLGLAGGLIGAAIGMVLSIGLGKAVFGVAARPRLIVYPISVALTVIVAILAAYPLRRLVHIRPASVFRGEE